jgi:toxin ParE1/3/4
MQARYLVPARTELFEAAHYYSGISMRLAVDFMREVERAVSEIEAFPQSAPMLADSVRRKVLRKYPHSLLYLTEPDAIVILAVMHHKRRPGYWEDRMT